MLSSLSYVWPLNPLACAQCSIGASDGPSQKQTDKSPLSVSIFNLFIVNKNDGDLAAQASKTASDYKSALSFYNKESNTLDTQVVLVSSVENKGMDLVLDAYNQITETNKNSNEFQNRRKNQLSYWLEEEVRNKILLKLNKDREISKKIANEVTKIISGDTGFYTASQAIIDTFLDKNK